MKPRVICVPGSVAPAAQRYKPLLDGVAGEAEVRLLLEHWRRAEELVPQLS